MDNYESQSPSPGSGSLVDSEQPDDLGAGAADRQRGRARLLTHGPEVEATRTIIVPLSRPDLGGLERSYVNAALDDGWISGTGKIVSRFERRLSKRLGRAHTVAVASGTAALELALRGLEISPGDEVIVPALTFAAPATSVLAVGASVVLADVSPDTWTISASAARAKLTRRTCAIIAVDVLGHPADYDELRDLGVPIIQDAAQAHGAHYKGSPVGSQGDVSIFSFHANKAITTGEGGSISTDSAALAERLRLIANHGMSPQLPYVHEVVGRNFRMTSLAAALGLAQLDRWEELIAARNRVSRRYAELLAGSGCGSRPVASWATFACWLHTVTVAQRAPVIEHLRSHGIDARAIWPPLHEQPVLKHLADDFPVASDVAERALWLPTYAAIADADIEFVAGHLVDALQRVGVEQVGPRSLAAPAEPSPIKPRPVGRE
jgi:perosamine synthetase